MNKKVLFIGSKLLGLKCLDIIYKLSPGSLAGVMTCDDRADGRTVYQDIKKFALDRKLAFYPVINRKEFEQKILEIKPDFCFVVGWYWLISEQILKAVPGGFIGIHGSLLPKYRGFAPLVWAIINGEKETGITLFQFDKEMDEGPIYGQQKIPIKPEDDIKSILEKVQISSIKILHKKYNRIITGRLKAKTQIQTGATYCAERTPADGLINWTASAEQIYNFVRAQTEPYPGAYTFFKNQKIIIYKAQKTNQVCYGAPGQVAAIGADGVSVVTGEQKLLKIEEISLKGEKHMPAAKIIKSLKYRLGTCQD